MKKLITLIFMFCFFVSMAIFGFSQIPTKHKKLNDSTLQVVNVDTVTQKITYSIAFLRSQRKAIVQSKKEFDDQRNLEIAQIDSLLSKAKKLGIK